MPADRRKSSRTGEGRGRSGPGRSPARDATSRRTSARRPSAADPARSGSSRGPAAAKRGPAPKSGVSARPGTRSKASSKATSKAASGTTAGTGAKRPGVRPRLTGRAAVLVLVVAVLAVSYASSLRAYIQQRSHISDLRSQIAEKEDRIDDLKVEKERWSDDAFIQAQARERLGFVLPGQTGYVLLDEHGKPVDARSSLSDPSTVGQREQTPVYEKVWDSLELAGHPPKNQPPADEIDGRTGTEKQ